jgi:hypothetical protein
MKQVINWLLGWRSIAKAKEKVNILGAWSSGTRIMVGYIEGDKFRNDQSGYFPLPSHFKNITKFLK